MKRISLLIFLCAVLALFAAPAWAAEVNVSTAADLKNAVNTNGNVINIRANIQLGSSTTTISIAQSVTINGNGHTISGDNQHRVFNITNGTVSINDLTITGGKVNGDNGGGIAISNSSANVTVNNCTFTGNTANIDNSNNGGNGGGIAVLSGSTGIITNCTFTDNEGHWAGGGIIVMGGSTATITNCTFTGNTAQSNNAAGAMRVHSNSTATIINCTFVNNIATPGSDREVEVMGVGSDKIGTLTAINTIFWNSGSSYVFKGNDATLTLTNCAYGANATSGTITDGGNNVKTLNWSGRTSEDVTVNGVEHTVFRLTASDTNLHTGGTTGDNVPTTDQLGVTRSTSNHNIGAVEYIDGIKISSDAALPEGTVGTAYNADLKAEFTPAQPNAEFKWEVTSGNLPAGLAIDGSTISGEPTTAGDYKFTLTATGSGDVYSIYSADQDFTLKINPKPEVSFDIGTVKITSTGGSSNIALELTSKDYSDLANTSSSDLTSLKTGSLTVASSDQASVVVTIDPGDGDIAGVFCGSDDVTVTGNEFTPSTAGTYKIIFKGTDGNGNVKYFAAGFTYSITDDTEQEEEEQKEEDGTVTSEDVEADGDGNLVIKSGTKISSEFVNLKGEALTAYVDNFFANSTKLSDSDRATAEDMAEFLDKMGITASDIGDEISGYKIIGAKLGKYISGNRPFLIIMKHTVTDRIFLGLGVTQLRSNVLSIKFDILQKAAAIVTDEKLSFPRGRYRVGATDAKEYLAKSAELSTTSKADTADTTEEIGSIYLGEFELAGTSGMTSSKGSSGGGCDAGLKGGYAANSKGGYAASLGALALLAFVPFITKIRK